VLYLYNRKNGCHHLVKIEVFWLWCRVMLWWDTIISHVHASSIFRLNLPWRWRRPGTLKRCYPTTIPHGVTTQKISTWNINKANFPANALAFWRNKCICTIRVCNQKFPDWPPGARTTNGIAACHWVQLHRYFVSQSIVNFAAITLVLLFNECLLL
jgi:hypothetical protein